MDANQEQEDQDETSNQYEPSMQCSKPTKLSGSSGHTAAAVGIRKQLSSGLEGGAPHIPMKPMNFIKKQQRIMGQPSLMSIFLFFLDDLGG